MKTIIAYTREDLPIDGGKVRYPETLEQALENADYALVEVWEEDNVVESYRLTHDGHGNVASTEKQG